MGLADFKQKDTAYQSGGTKLKNLLPYQGKYAPTITVPKSTTTPAASPTTPTKPKSTTPTVTSATPTPQTDWSNRSPAVPEQERPAWIPPGTSGSSGGGSKNLANSAYQDALDELRRQEELEKEAARQRTAATIDSINSNIPTINQDYENQQAQNYITHTKNMYGLGDYLRAMGLSGGMSESKAGELTANYETSRNTADQAKNNALENIRKLIAQAEATGDQEVATIASNATKAYQDLLAQQAAAELQTEQFNTEQAQENQQYQDSLTQQAFENDLATKEYNLAVQKAKTTGSSGGSGAKLTAGAVQNMYDSGLIDEQQAAEMYRSLGINIPGTQPTTNYYSEAERLLQQRTVPSSQLALIRQYNTEGKLSDDQAITLLKKYGLYFE